jgi:transcriptional regulator with XRE-family HTH domain
VISTPTDQLVSLGVLVRAARRARGLTQQRTAEESGVSRAQLALLEKGRNVSVLFILKVARYLGLTLELTVSSTEPNVVGMLRVIEGIGASLDELKSLAVEAALPPSIRGLDDAAALKTFIERHGADAADRARLGEVIRELSNDPSRPSKTPKRIAGARSRRSRRAGEK